MKGPRACSFLGCTAMAPIRTERRLGYIARVFLGNMRAWRTHLSWWHWLCSVLGCTCVAR